jgi:ATP-dependent helicase/nuclease subunit A
METALPSSTSEYVKKIVKAGAGAGKTHDLVEKIYRMVSPDHVPHIIVCTFTKKATQELKERIIKKTITDKDVHPKKFKSMLGFIKSSSHLHISTIHGVLTLFLQSQGSAFGLDPEFCIVEDAESLKLQKNLFFEYLSASDSRALDLYRSWGWQRLAYILEKHRETLAFNPNLAPLNASDIELDLIDQKNALWKNILELLQQLEPHALKNPSSALFQFYTQMDYFAKQLNLGLDPQDSTPNLEQLKILYQQIPQRLGSLKGIDDSTKELKKQVHEDCQKYLEDPYLLPETRLKFVHQNQLIDEFSREFNQKLNQLKIEVAELAIKDLELFSLNLCEKSPESAHSFSQRWDYWFIDEFQDTNPIQVKLLRKLIGDKSYYLVGDPQQSIYFFRGARSQIFKDEWAHLLNAGHLTEEKSINRRSQARLLYFINDFMVSLNQKQFTEMHPFHLTAEHQEPVAEIHIAKTEEQNETTMLVKSLNDFLIAGVRPNEIAVLCRENKELLQILKHAKKINAPVQIVGKGNFFERIEVKDALTCYYFLINPHNDRNLINLLKSPYIDLADEELIPFTKKNFSIWTLLNSPLHLEKVSRLQKFLNLAQIEGVFSAWIHLLKEIKIFEYSQKIDTTGICEANLWKLVHIIQEDLLPLQFQNEANALPALNQEAILLMTVHASKGLEFEYVLIPFLDHNPKKTSVEPFMLDFDNNNFLTPFENHHPQWSYKITEQTDQFLSEENERLLYVAVTRAKKKILFYLNSDFSESKSSWVKHLTRFLKPQSGLFETENNYTIKIDYT